MCSPDPDLRSDDAVPGFAGARTVRLGLDSFSYHRWFGENNEWEDPVAERWTIDDLLGHVEGLDVDIISLQTVHLPDRSPSTLVRLRRQLDKLGIDCILAWGHRSGLEDGHSLAKLEDALDALHFAKDLGCDIARVVCGDQYSWSDDAGARRDRLQCLRTPLIAIARSAEQLGLDVAIENHADVRVVDLVALVASIESERLGICFDVGNAVRVGDDPVAAAREAAAWIVMAHLRDLKILEGSRRRPDMWWPCVNLGAGDLDIPAVLDALTRAPRCDAWLVEASNMLPGHTEDEFVTTSLAYLRTRLGHP